MARLKTLGLRVQQTAGPRIKVASSGSWREGKTSTQRGYGYKWQKARAAYLLLNPLCAYCARLGRTTGASVVDHIVPHQGDQELFWRQSNWQSLCKPCHDSVKQAEEKAGY